MPCENHDGCPISGAQNEFRARIAAEIEHAAAFLTEHRSTDEEKAEVAGAALGAFGGGHIDASRFQTLLGAGGTADPGTLDQVAQAAASLQEQMGSIDEMTKIACPPAASLRHVLADALGRIGLVFGAARVIELARTSRFRAAEHGRYLLGLPFAQWSRAERDVAPWIRVKVRGEDLHAAGLAEFLDGDVHLVLRVEGACPPAPLARLASPGVYVAQVRGKADLDGFKSFEGPAVAALVPEGAAIFTHDPRRGRRPFERFEVAELPRAPRHALGGIGASQMAEDLALLETLSSTPVATGNGTAAEAAPVDPADQLASWLLHEAGLVA